MRRKFLSVLLAMAMVLTMVPVTALAANGDYSLTDGTTTVSDTDPIELTYGDALSTVVLSGYKLQVEDAGGSKTDVTLDSTDGALAWQTPTQTPSVSTKTATVTFKRDGQTQAETLDVPINVTAKEVTITSITGDNKNYDGTTDATLTVVLDNTSLKTGDNVTATATGTFASKDAGTDVAISSIDVTLDGTDAGNYSVPADLSSLTTGAKANITAVKPTNIAIGSTVLYNGTVQTGKEIALTSSEPTATITGITPAGVGATAETGTAVGTLSWEKSGSSIGTWGDEVAVGDTLTWKFVPAANNNYSAADIAGVTGTVTVVAAQSAGPEAIDATGEIEIEAPATGGTPATSMTLPAGAHYAAASSDPITWNGTLDNGKFAAATVYKATVKLTASTGYKFAADPTVSVKGINAAKITGKSVSADAEGNTLTFTVEFPATAAAPKTLTSIAVTKNPTKTVYGVGENFDPTGMVVTATYSDDSTATLVETTGYTLSGNTSLTKGTAAITIKAVEDPDVTTTLDVTVQDLLSTAVGTLSITGTAKFGEELTAEISGTPTPALDTPVYTWYRGAEVISGATGAKYTLVQADIGEAIKVELTASNYYGKAASVGTSAVAKADTANWTAEAVEASKTHSTITITAPTTPSVPAGRTLEYGIVAGSSWNDAGAVWQDGLTFRGLTAATQYTIVTRVKETATHVASAHSTGIQITTNAAPTESLQGTLTIDNITPKYGDTLSAVTTALTVSNASTLDEAKLYFVWYRGSDVIPDQNAKTYTVTADDIDKTIKVEAFSEDLSGSVPSTDTTAVVKADQSQPAALTANDLTVTATSITVKAPVDGMVYAVVEGPNGSAPLAANPAWKSGAEAFAVSADTAYTVFAMKAGTDTHNASPASTGYEVTTPAASVDTVAPPTISVSGNTVTIRAEAGTTIYYTTDGSEPTTDSTRYEAPFTVSSNCTVKAIAVKGLDESTVASANVTVSSGSRPSGGSSGGGGGTSSSVTVPVSGDDNSVNVSAKVSGNEATIEKIDGLDKVIDSGASTGVVEIDLTALNRNIDTVKLPTNDLEDIADAAADGDNDVDGLSVKLDSGTVEFDVDALAAIASQATTGSIELKLEKTTQNSLNSAQKDAVADMEVHGHFDLTLNGGKVITDFKGGQVTVRIPFTVPADKDSAGFVVVYVANDGTTEEMDTRCSGSYITFTTGHFSKYLIVYKDSEAVDEPADQPDSATCDGGANCPANKFTDVNTDLWYHNAIDFVLTNGLMSGVGDSTFAPNANLSRAMLAQILYNQEGKPAVTNTSVFDDVAAGMWYTNAIAWAAENGVVSGLGDGKFGPNNNITREQLAVMLFRYAGSPSAAGGGSLDRFADGSKASSYAQEALVWATGMGIMNGKGGGMLDPQGQATRAEVAQMLYNYLNI